MTKQEAGFKSRTDLIFDFTGAEVAAMIRVGSLIVSSRPHSETNMEVLETHPDMAEQLAHFTNCAYYILLRRTKVTERVQQQQNIVRPGSHVVLKDISSQPTLNGEKGVAQAYDHSKGRWVVELDNDVFLSGCLRHVFHQSA